MLEITIGRDKNSTYPLSDTTVSSSHASIALKNGRYWIVDRGSSNGTFVNGRRIVESILMDGDTISFGQCKRIFINGELHEAEKANLEKLLLHEVEGKVKEVSLSGKQISLIGAVLVLIIGALVFSQRSSSDLFSQPQNIENLIDGLRSATPKIECDEGEYSVSGSGIPLNTKSLGEVPSREVVITNAHVVENCDPGSLYVTTKEGTKQAEVIGLDKTNDLALLSTSLALQPFGVSREAPIGSWVMAIGNPLGIDGNVTFGTISTQQDGYFVTDAAINSGNSGGPLINSNGKVVGVNVAKLEDADNIGFAIPIIVLCDSLVKCK